MEEPSFSKRGLPPPTHVKFTAFHDRSRIVNVYKRIETFINVSFTTNPEKSRKLLSVGAGDYPPIVKSFFLTRRPLCPIEGRSLSEIEGYPPRGEMYFFP